MEHTFLPVQRRVASTMYMQNNIIHCKYRCVYYTCPAAYRPKRVPVNKAGHSGVCVVHDTASCWSPCWIQSVLTHSPTHPLTIPWSFPSTRPYRSSLVCPDHCCFLLLITFTPDFGSSKVLDGFHHKLIIIVFFVGYFQDFLKIFHLKSL